VRCYQLTLEQRGTGDGHFWFEYAAVLLLSGDREGYARVCMRLVEWGGRAPGVRPYHVARACTLSPAASKSVIRATLLASDELNASGDHWALTEQAAILYRTGHVTDAAPLLMQSLDATKKPGAAVVNWVWLALANQNLGKDEAAQQYLERVRHWLANPLEGMPANGEQDVRLDLHNWLEAHVLLRELEALRKGAAKSKPDGQTGKQ
jgi:hypothetical protein